MADFTETYDQELWRVYGFIAYRVTNRSDAEDLTQQTFERALGHWSQFDPARASMRTWLLSIARNLIVDHYRAGARGAGQVALHEVSEEHLPRSHDVSADLGLSAELSTALMSLGERERELLALRFGADLAGPEIAAVTGLTLANVQQILSRSLRKLREGLDDPSAARRDLP